MSSVLRVCALHVRAHASKSLATGESIFGDTHMKINLSVGELDAREKRKAAPR
jgi:hypothetical protein